MRQMCSNIFLSTYILRDPSSKSKIIICVRLALRSSFVELIPSGRSNTSSSNVGIDIDTVDCLDDDSEVAGCPTAMRYRPSGVSAKSTTRRPVRINDRESIRVPKLSCANECTYERVN